MRDMIEKKPKASAEQLEHDAKTPLYANVVTRSLVAEPEIFLAWARAQVEEVEARHGSTDEDAREMMGRIAQIEKDAPTRDALVLSLLGWLTCRFIDSLPGIERVWTRMDNENSPNHQVVDTQITGVGVAAELADREIRAANGGAVPSQAELKAAVQKRLALMLMAAAVGSDGNNSQPRSHGVDMMMTGGPGVVKRMAEAQARGEASKGRLN